MEQEKKFTFIRLAPKHYKLYLHGNEYDVRVIGSGQKQGDVKPLYLEIDGRLEEVMIDIKEYEEVVEEVAVPFASAEISKPRMRIKATRDGDVTCPIPGKVVDILVRVGDHVKVGQAVLIVEAMKMDNEIHAPKDGIDREIYVEKNDTVMPDEALIFID
jgi:pyruvate carboxylase subunit B